MKKLATLASVYKVDGVSGVFLVIKEKVLKFFRKEQKIEVKFLVSQDDVMNCEWDTNPKVFDSSSKKGPYVFNWVVSPPGKGSGGHQNIFRFIRYLEQAGHTCRIYLYAVHSKPTLERIYDNISTSYAKLDASIQWLDGQMEPADAIFATGWETAYPVYNDDSNARRFYFVQDFEPYFYTMGTEYILAENTYKFGFTGITAGRWLTSKLGHDYGMKCDFYDFGVDTSIYNMEDYGDRKRVFFYARPVTSRRGFEMGLMALEKFHNLNPNYEIAMAGWDVSNYEINFPMKDYGVCTVEELASIYKSSSASLILSFSNLSLLPLELLSCGVIPVINKGPNNEMVLDNEFMKYSEATPNALALALDEVVNREDLVEYAQKASQSVSNLIWQDSGDKFVSIVEREMLD